MGQYTQKAGTKSIIKETMFHACGQGKTESGRPIVFFEFIKAGDIIRQYFLIDNLMGLKDCCDFIRSIPIPETQRTHIYKNEKQFSEFLKMIYNLFKQVQPISLKITRDGTPHGYDRFDLEVSASASGWQRIKILNIITTPTQAY